MDSDRLLEEERHVENLHIDPRKFNRTHNGEYELVPQCIDVEQYKYGDVIILFKRPTEMRLGQKFWKEQAGIELHTLFTCQDYGHCEVHFVQSDVGLGIGVDADDVVFMWNKGYDSESYDLVYRIKMKSSRYNTLLQWCIDLAYTHPKYDRTYMYRSCWFCWCRSIIPLSFSDARRHVYTCASLTYSVLAIAGFVDLSWEHSSREERNKRQANMLRDRNVIVSDVQDLLEGTSSGRFTKSSDIVLVEKLDGVPERLQLIPVDNGK
jgi:hypothetical protein